MSRLFGAVTSGSIEFVVCDRLLEEVKRALQRPYFAQRLQPDAPELFCAALRLRGVMVSDPEDPPAVLRGPNDDYLVALAQNCEVDAIVTGDHDLLDHDGLQPRAITVRQACEELGIP